MGSNPTRLICLWNLFNEIGESIQCLISTDVRVKSNSIPFTLTPRWVSTVRFGTFQSSVKENHRLIDRVGFELMTFAIVD